MRQKKEHLVLAIPSKGQLHESTLRFLEACEMPVSRGSQGREYIGRLGGISSVEVLFLRAEEIPDRIQRGDVQLGISGKDLFCEHLGVLSEDLDYENAEGMHSPQFRHSSHVLINELGYGGARLVVAVPRGWIDVTSMADIEEIAPTYRQCRGRVLRVATKFPRLTRKFFADHKISDYLIVHSSGATEAAPSSGIADIIVDLSSTGATLAQNHLKEINGGTIIASQACLIASSRQDYWNEETLLVLQQIVERVEAYLHAKVSKVVQFAALRSSVRQIVKEIEKNFRCIVQSHGRLLWNVPVFGGDNSIQVSESVDANQFVEITAICPSTNLYQIIMYLREAGCQGVMVFRTDFIFEQSDAVGHFRRLLRHIHEEPARADFVR